jgi:hypothetical protein
MPARQPRALIRLNGGIVPGCVEFTVTNNSFYEADTYHLVFAASKLPISNNAIWFAEQTETFVEILAGFPSAPDNPDPNELTSFIYGRIDDLEFDPVAQTLTLAGRDLTAALIDAKIASEYTNKKSSDIATLLAQGHGLTPQVTATSTNVGSYFEQDTMQLQAGRSEWDLLSFLAREEGFVTYVAGHTLYFGPDQTGTGNSLVLTYIAPTVVGGPPSGNFTDVSFSRSQTVVKGISVTVRSAGRYNPTITRSYPVAPRGTAPGKASPFGPTSDYFYNMPAGATPQQVEQRAQKLYNQIIQHAMKLKARLPADVTTGPTSTIDFHGTGTAFDQTYFPRAVTRHMSIEGFTMEIDAQNTSPNLTPA